MRPPLAGGQLYFCHQDQVTKLPASADLIAGNDFCPNGIFAIGDQVLGIQGHPEFTRAVMAQLLVELQSETGEQVSQSAEASLRMGEPDGEVFAQWVANFLQA